MMECTLSQAAEAMHGKLRGADGRFRGVSTDTRTLSAGELFFALHGPNFDGNEFVDSAAESSAAAAVVDSPVGTALPSITVDDTRVALGELAAAWREKMPATVIGVTGSNGKTTLKELIAGCLEPCAATLATRGNLNNEIGLPLMLSCLGPEHRFAVIEMGANHPGEIAYLAGLARPQVVVITNAAPAHLEGFGSLDGVARAKGEVLESVPRPRIAVLNADDEFYPYWRELAEDADVITFGLGPSADVRATDIVESGNGSRFTLHLPAAETVIELPLPGPHNVSNACAAAAVATVLEVSLETIRRGLESARPVSGRLTRATGRRGETVYDDSYNANPESVIAAAEFLARQPGQRTLILGDMGELGADSAALHSAVGRAAKNAGLDRLLATGESSRLAVEAFGDGGSWFATIEELIAALGTEVAPDGTVLIKGSRAARMERVVAALVDAEGRTS